MDSNKEQHKIDFSGYYDLAKAIGQENPEKLQDHELLTLLKEPTNRYSNLNSYNQGGMKKILSGHDAVSGRNIAIAQMLNYNDPDDLELFLREARITACLEHPNIVPVYDISLNEEGFPFFTMKLIQGEDLGEIISKIKNNPSSTEKYRLSYLLEIFMKVCDAIAYAHSRGVIHLDLKPENIKLSDYGEVIVCDWGLARLVDDADPELVMKDSVAGALAHINRTINGIVKGTPGYMSPEQANGENHLKNLRSDIYSLGAILYSILTLEKPIDGKTMEEILQKTIDGDIIPPRKKAPQRKIPYSLEMIVLKAMSIEQEDRYDSVLALQNDIRAYLEGFATSAENAPFHRLLLLLFKRHAALSLLTSTAIVTVSILTYTYLESLEENRQKLEEARLISETEQQKRQNLSENAAEILLQQTYQLITRNEYEKALEEINKCLSLKPDWNEALEIKAILLISSLQFAEAKEVALKIPEYTNQYFIALADKYIKFTDEKGLISPENFIMFMSEIQNDRLLEEQGDYEKFKQRVSAYIEKQLVNYTFTLYPLQQRLAILQEMLELSNPQSSEIKLKINMGNDGTIQLLEITNNMELTNAEVLAKLPIQHLNLSNTGIKSIDFAKNLPLQTLNLSGTSIHNLFPLEHLSLQELNLKGTPVTDLSPIMKLPLRKIHLGSIKVNPLNLMNIFPYLQELYLPAGLYSSQELNLLNKNIQLYFE